MSEPIVFRVAGLGFTLGNLSEDDTHLHWVIDQHRPAEGRSFCPVCDLRAPCDMVSLAASGLARSAGLRASQAEAKRLIDGIGLIAERRMGICPLCDEHWNSHGAACPVRAAFTATAPAPAREGP